MELPITFEQNMRTLLQDDYDSYAACLEQPMHHGIRINTMKISVEEFLKINPFHLRPVPWCENGFYYDGENKKGEVITPLTLKAGKYTVEEIKTPDGFLDTNPIEFKIQKDYVSKTDEDPTIEVVIENEQPVGKLVVKKSIQTTESDKSFIDSSKLEGISFILSAKEDVVSAIDGTTVYKTNQLVGTYTTDKNGNIEINDLPLGHYVLKETQTLYGLVFD